MVRSLTASLLALALGAAACGDAQQAEPVPTVFEETSPTVGSTTTTLVPPEPTDPPEVPRPVIGDLELPCGAVDRSALPDQPGVSDTAVAIGTGNDRGGLATPDAGRGITEAVAAFSDHCNSLGGVAGREIVVIDYDAAGVETAARLEEACGEVAAMVGFRYLDATAATAAAKRCGLPLLPAAFSESVAPVLLHGEYTALIAAPAAAGRVALVGPETASGVFARQRRAVALGVERADGESSPFTVVAQLGYPIDAPPDWEQIVGDARASGAGAVRIDGGCAYAVVPFLGVARAAGWDPVVISGVESYDERCVEEGDLVARLVVEMPLLPFEDGDAAPATAAHAAILDASGAPRTGNALLAASSLWRWVVAVDRCGSRADRPCVEREAAAVDGWTGGGIHVPLGADGPTAPCAVVMGVRDGRWIRLLPAEPAAYECNPQWAVGGA